MPTSFYDHTLGRVTHAVERFSLWLARGYERILAWSLRHRLSTIAAMDRLVVMDEGRIVEEGSHADLLRRGGIYAGLWQRQSGGFLAQEAAE